MASPPTPPLPTPPPSFLVAIKVRPLLRVKGDDTSSWKIRDNSIQLIDSQSDPYYFDFIFDANTSNEFIFEKMARHIVHSSIQGFNGTIFAYGQTSSGKTYTMMGDEQNPGVIVLAAKEIFKEVEKSVDRKFLLRVGYFEIYNEKIYDLLNKDNKDLKIHEANSVNCEEKVILCEKDLLNFLCLGNKNRTVGETQMNNRSSRSHAIFRVIIESRKKDRSEDDAFICSVLNLVDLAGSERADQTGARGTRLKEGGHINKSLLFLSNVIKQLSENEDHKYISYRDSKLTRILQASLGGNALTSIICTIKPTAIDETQSTLNFALRAKNIKNKPQVNETVSDAQMLKRLNEELKNYKILLDKERQKNLSQHCFGKIEKRINDESHQIVNFYTSNTCNIKDKRRRTWCLSNNKNDENRSVIELLDKFPNEAIKTTQNKHLTPHIGLRNPDAKFSGKTTTHTYVFGSNFVKEEENSGDENHTVADRKLNQTPEKNDYFESTLTPPAVKGTNTLQTDSLELKEFINIENQISFDFGIFNGLKDILDISTNHNVLTGREILSYNYNIGETKQGSLGNEKRNPELLSIDQNEEPIAVNKSLVTEIINEFNYPEKNSLPMHLIKTTQENRLLKQRIRILESNINTIFEKNNKPYENFLNEYEILQKLNSEIVSEVHSLKSALKFSIPKNITNYSKFIYEIELDMGCENKRVFRLLEDTELRLPAVRVQIKNNDKLSNLNLTSIKFIYINLEGKTHTKNVNEDLVKTVREMQRQIDGLKKANDFLLTENEKTIKELRGEIETLSVELFEKSLYIEKCASEKDKSLIFDTELTRTKCENMNQTAEILNFEKQLGDANATISQMKKKYNELQLEQFEKLDICEKEFRENIRKYNKEWESSNQKYEIEICELEKKLQDIDKCKEVAQHELQIVRLQHSNETQEYVQKLSEAHEKICELQQGNQKLLSEVKIYENKSLEMERTVEAMNDSLKSTRNQILELEEEKSVYTNKNIILEMENSLLQNKFLELSTKYDLENRKCKEIAQHELQMVRLQHSNEAQEYVQKLSEAHEKICELQQGNQKLLSEVQIYENKSLEMERRVEEMNTTLKSTRNQILQLEKEKSVANDKNIFLEKEISLLQNKFLELSRKYDLETNKYSSFSKTIDLIENFTRSMYETIFEKENIHRELMLPMQAIVVECSTADEFKSFAREESHSNSDKCSTILEFIKTNSLQHSMEINSSVLRLYDALVNVYIVARHWRKFAFDITPLTKLLKRMREDEISMKLQIENLTFQLFSEKDFVVNMCRKYERIKKSLSNNLNAKTKHIRILEITLAILNRFDDGLNEKVIEQLDRSELEIMLLRSEQHNGIFIDSQLVLRDEQQIIGSESGKSNIYEARNDKNEHQKYKMIQETNSCKEILERKNRRLNMYNERRHVYCNMQISSSNVSTMTDFSVEKCCYCSDLAHKLKECDRKLFIQESRVTALRMELKNHPLKKEIFALEKRLKEEQEKNKLEIAKYKQLFHGHINQISTTNIVLNNMRNSATQTEIDIYDSLKKLQGKYDDLKKICRARYTEIKELKDKFENKENADNNKEHVLTKKQPW